MFERSVQLLACEVQVLTDVEGVIEHVDRVRPSALQDHPVTHRHRIDVRCVTDGYIVREDEGEPEIFAGLDGVSEFIDRRFHELAFEKLTDFTKLHAGCARWLGRRFLVVGHRGAGKTTLMTRLLFEGCAVEGDEMVLVNGGRVVAYPRRFGIRQRTLKLIPAVGSLAPHLLEQQESDDPCAYQVLAMDPAQLGFEWRITSGPVDVLFFLASRHAGPTHVVPCSPQSMAQHMMGQSAPPDSGSGAWIRDIGDLARHAAAYEVVVGDLDSAVSSVRECILGSRDLAEGD